MISRVTKRFASSSVTPPKPQARKGRKGHLYGPNAKTQEVTPEEQVKIVTRRMQKAERDERMDITMTLSPVKTYMGGFTRPRDLRITNWFPGGRYRELNKSSENPPEAAYQPYTVFLLESRYPVKHGIGRCDHPDWVFGLCRAGDLQGVLARYNSERAPVDALAAMDNARWPWTKQKPNKRTRWWEKGETPVAALKEILGPDADLRQWRLNEIPGNGNTAGAVVFESTGHLSEEHQERLKSVATENVAPSAPGTPVEVHGDLLSSSGRGDLSMRTAHIRPFSTSAVARSDSYNQDDVVPSFYVQRKQRRANTLDDLQKKGIKEGQERDDTLMEVLSDGTLSDSIAASTKRMKAKIPVEFFNAEGNLEHPSGFTVPKPGKAVEPMSERRERDLAQQTAAVAERVLEEDLEDVSAYTRSHTHKVPWEVRDAEGNVSHPSGFVPPTPIHGFKVSMSTDPPSVVSRRDLKWGDVPVVEDEVRVQAQEVSRDANGEVTRVTQSTTEAKTLKRDPNGEQKSAKPASNGEQKRSFHTTVATRAGVLDDPPPPAPRTVPEEPDNSLEDGSQLTSPTELHALRAQYLPTLAAQPFWRPVITATLSTRPLAATLVRLSRAMPRGLPYHAAMASDDRKYGVSFAARQSALRVGRVTDLVFRIGEVLAGARGGAVGVRFAPNQTPRGTDGAGLADPIPDAKRKIAVGVGSWYPYADELIERFESEMQDNPYFELNAPFELYKLDDRGVRTAVGTGEVVPWPPVQTVARPGFLDEEVEEDVDEDVDEDAEEGEMEREKRRLAKERAAKMRKRQIAEEHGRELAAYKAQKHNQVLTP